MTGKTKSKAAKAQVKALEKKVSRMKIKSQKTPFGDVGHIIGNTVGSMFGNSSMGKGVGRWLGTGIGSIFGSGDYTLNGAAPGYNVLTNGSQIPKFSVTRQSNIVCHREYLGDINGTAAFNNTAYPLNPGMSSTFPWLSSLAANYQEYKFHGIIFEFRSLITDFVTSGAPGVVVMSTNYNADGATYSTKQQMENAEFAVSVKPTCNMVHGVECADNQTILPQRYVRSSTPPSGQDLRLYDLGTFQFATQQNPLQDLGELWVSYCVEFFKPVLPAGGIGTDTAHVQRFAAGPANPCGTSSIISTGSLALTVSSSTIKFLGIPQTLYSVELIYTSLVAGNTAPGNPTFVNAVLSSIYYTGTPQNVLTSGLGVVASTTSFIKCTSLNPDFITITPTTAIAANCVLDIIICEMSPLVTA